jgi:hypothetical protein
LSKEIEGSGRTGRGNTIQGFRKREGSGKDGRNRVGNSSILCNTDGNCTGHKFPLSMNASFGMSQFSISIAEIKETFMDSKHLVMKYSLKVEEKIIDTHALIDCGATGIAFIDKDFVRNYGLHEKEQKETRELEVMDGRPIESGTITTMAKLDLGI